ncbi:hypothetical protein [Pseudarthrobacter enclensis]|uniref:Uncharacterized protein n=1 Tax=Pseudarthrobacter enclensis TaxID=993070 RepID=A0ABT9RT39_9MICC|nr:hypothetical protein [Pseudarthrobacter enclensis]MDP9888411.1 hypothetical protein [Pseudarthrobacter enclensis]
MARKSSPWRALRPALLAGAAAITWLTLSSAAASADTGQDSPPLPGGVTNSVSSLTQDLSGAVSPAPAGFPAGTAAGPGVLQPVAAPVSGLADNLIASVPALNLVVPAGSVSSVSAPLAGAVDDVSAGVAQGVVAPAVEAVPVLDPVLQPVSDLLTGSAPLPVAVPDAPIEVVPTQLPVAANLDSADAGPSAPEAAADIAMAAAEPDEAAAVLTAAAPAGSNAGHERSDPVASGDVLHFNIAAASAPVEPPLTGGPVPLPGQAPAAPGSGTGSSGSSGSPSGAAAWLSPFDLGLDRPGVIPVGDSSQHLPAPVSFDPGSSPD